MVELISKNKPTLIVTRPAEQAMRLVTRLTQASQRHLTILNLPLIKVVPKEFSALAESHYNGAIFVSRNAVKFFYQFPTPSIEVLCAVGNNTAASIACFSKQPIIFPEQMNAEGLLALPELAHIGNQHWLVIKGIGGRTIISDTLHQRGAKVTEVEVYQRKLPDYAVQKAIKEAFCVNPTWLITSAEALTNLHRILGLANTPQHATNVIVSSQRLANLAVQKGFTILAQSAGASETQLVQCVKKRFNIQE